MSFASGTADTRENLLDLFRAFAVVAGWTVDRFAASGTGSVLNIHKVGSHSTVYASLRSVNNENLPGSMPAKVGIVLSMATGYDESKDCVNQPGAPASVTNATDYFATSIHPFTAVAKYWFFANTDPEEFLALVVMLPDGTLRHLVIGEVRKTDTTITSGVFMFGTNGMSTGYSKTLPFQTGTGTTDSYQGTSWLHMGADERVGWWNPCSKDDGGSGYSSEGRAIGALYRDSLLLYNSVNAFSNSPALSPVILYGRRTSNLKFFPIGYVPSLRIGRRSAFIVDTEYPLGSDTWMAFPQVTQTDTYALVYRKTT